METKDTIFDDSLYIKVDDSKETVSKFNAEYFDNPNFNNDVLPKGLTIVEDLHSAPYSNPDNLYIYVESGKIALRHDGDMVTSLKLLATANYILEEGLSSGTYPELKEVFDAVSETDRVFGINELKPELICQTLTSMRTPGDITKVSDTDLDLKDALADLGENQDSKTL